MKQPPWYGVPPTPDAVHIDHEVGDVPINGSYAVSPTVSTTYTITASGPEGTASARVRVAVEDYFTFDQSGMQLDDRMFTFTPDGSHNFYYACSDSRESGAAFPIDPAGGTLITLGDDDYEWVELTDGAPGIAVRCKPFFLLRGQQRLHHLHGGRPGLHRESARSFRYPAHIGPVR